MKRDVSMVIASIPPRMKQLGECLASVYGQTHQPREVCLSIDTPRRGAPQNRQRALEMATSTWVAAIDDDDILLPQYLDRVLSCAEETGADYVYSYFVRTVGGDPLGHFGKVFDNSDPIQTTVTTLIRRELAQEVGYHRLTDQGATWTGEDFNMTLGCVALGAKIVHLPEELWIWRRWEANTSGLPERWK